MSYEIGNPEMAWLLLLAPLALLLIGYSGWKSRTALAKFGVQPTTGRLIRSVVSCIALVLGIVLLAVACMDVRWGKTTREVPQKGLEVVFALDVSRSMLAEDARPNRLARAKQQITDMVGEMAGDRIGLVVFAGNAKQAIPLTNHYNDFRQKLDSVGPQSVTTGGSQLGTAIETAADAFLSKTNDHKTVILFTDGEDQESKPVELARRLFAENGMRIFTVGLGDIDKGARIPQARRESGQFVEHQGQQVWSKLNGSILQQIATETQAAYIPAGTKRVNMADVYHNYIAQVEQSEFETAKVNAFIPRFQWFAFPAFVLLLVHGWLTSSGIRQNSSSAQRSGLLAKSTTPKESLPSKRSGSTKSKVAAAAVIFILLSNIANAQSTALSTNRTVAEQINAANELVRQKSYNEAIDAFNAIDTTSQNERDSLNYDLAIAHYGNSDVEAASALFAESAKSNNDRIAADSRYNLGNCHFAKSLTLDQQPKAAIEELALAVVQYRSAIRLDRQHAAARENLERATKLIKQLEDQEKEEQQQNEQQQDENQSKESQQQQNQQDSSEDSKQSDQSEEESNSDQESANESNDSKESGSESNDENSSEANPSQQDESKSEQSESQDDSQKESQNDSGEDAESKQQSGEKSQDAAQGDPQQQQPNAETSDGSKEPDELEPESSEKGGEAPPQGDIKAADDAGVEPQSDDESQMSIGNPDLQNEDGMMSRQEALKVLQSVRDRDMIRRLRQQQRQRSRRVQVEKDW